jgi:hypothetical protein
MNAQHLRQGYDFVDSNEDIDIESPEEEESSVASELKSAGEPVDSNSQREQKETIMSGENEKPKSLELVSGNVSKADQTNKTNNERLNTIKSQNKSEDKLIIRENQF